jgi:Xaa-Pro dipeptidase
MLMFRFVYTVLGLVAVAALLPTSGRAAGAAPKPTPAQRAEEIRLKEERLRAFLRTENLDGVLIGTQRNFAWLTAGGDNHVVFNTEEGAALLLWTPQWKHVIAANNEMPRLTDEELAGLGYEPAPFAWHDEVTHGARARLIVQLAQGKRIGSDLPAPPAGTVDVSAKFAALRAQLTPGELERYRWLARTAAEVVEATARGVTRGQTEQAIQAEVARRLMGHDILPTVLLVAADDRITRYKHPITKDTAVQREAMITLCARKWGLVVAVTRHVHLGPLPAELQRKQDALAPVFAAMVAATRIGATSGDVFAAAQQAYSDAGYPDGWQAHHLGGAIGYREREYRAAPGSKQPVLDLQAFAWNPTLPGVKAEDTVLVKGSRIETLTDTGQWPRGRLEAAGRIVPVPLILVKD